MTDVLPGDVLLVRIKGRAWPVRAATWLITLGSQLEHEPSEWTHVIVADHIDPDTGTFWGMQGQPGVVSQVDIQPWLDDPNTITNAAMEKTDAQRQQIVAAMQPLLGRAGYDWLAILGDAAQALTASKAQRYTAPLWSMIGKWGKGVPGHVVCSSLADWAYGQVGLPSPAPDRFCTPGDWARWMQAQTWWKA